MPEDAPRPDAGGDLDGGADDAGADDAGPLPDSGGADAGTDAGALAMDSGPDAAPPGFECVSASECGSSSIGDGATYACEGGRCAVTGCGAGFGDCDFAADNGCEQVLDTASHCGGCGLTCGGPGAECVAGACGAIVQLVGGNAHQCYRRESGAVYCWGNNDDGELGDGMPTSSTVTLPVQVVGLDAIDIAAGGRHSCAIERGGQVVCWGRNSRGQLGDGTIMERTAPTPCVGLPDPVTDPAVDVSAGDEHSCAVFASGELYCWGRQSDSRLGNVVNSSTGLPTPVQVNGAHLFDAVTAGQNSTCGLRRDGEVLCWGNRAEGQLGDGSTTGIRGAPSALVALLDGAISVLNSPRAGARNGCAERGDGTLACWGAGRGLGYGGTIARSYAVTPVGIETIGTYGVGDSATCATNPFGDLYCWGSAVPLPEFTGLTHVDLVAITDRIWALSEGRIYSFPLGGSRTLVEGF